MSEGEPVRRGPPVGRHAAAVGLILVLGFVFWHVHWDPGDGYLGYGVNLVLADLSLVLLCLILILGPVARFVPRVRRLMPWQRELGIGMFITAGLHLLILLGGGWDILRFVYLEPIQSLPRELATDIGAGANWVGLLALTYAFVLAATSNDWAHRSLGRGWKFLQRQTYTLFVLVWLHTVVWVSFPIEEGGGFGFCGGFATWFWVLTTAAVLAQFAGFVHTIRATRGYSPPRPPPKVRSSVAAVGAAKWAAITALWGGLIIGSVLLANAESPEFIRLCEAYEAQRKSDQPVDLEELRQYMPPDYDLGYSIGVCLKRP